MKLEDLKKEMPYKWRIQSYSKWDAKASCVAYIDSRDVQDKLDDVCGPGGWQDDYKVVDGKLFCGVSVRIGDEWITKWDTGTESQTEAEKGKVSDAFKRAAVKWGVGRFLYSLGIRSIRSSGKKEGGNRPHPVDDRGNRIWDLTKHFAGEQKPTVQGPPSDLLGKIWQAAQDCWGDEGDHTKTSLAMFCKSKGLPESSTELSAAQAKDLLSGLQGLKNGEIDE